jgi:phage gpG-like protein
MFRSFDLNFKRQGRPRKWKALSRNTIASRRKFSKKVLQDTGRLRMSVMARSAPGNIYKLTSDSLKMGSRMKIAGWHQWGTEPYTIVPKNKTILRFMTPGGPVFAKQVKHPGLPARPFVLIQNEDVRAMTKVFAEHVVGE